MKRARVEMLCLCAMPVVKRTSRKENANKGRTFWACPARMGEGCGFFEWTDDAPKNWLTMEHEKRVRIENASCQCKAVPRRRQTTKEGVNKGRWFLSCTKCNKFLGWDSPVVEQAVVVGTEEKYEKDEKDETEWEATAETGYSVDTPGYDYYKAHPTIQYTRLMGAMAGKSANLNSVPRDQRFTSIKATEEKVEEVKKDYAMTIDVPDDWDWNVPYAAMYNPAG